MRSTPRIARPCCFSALNDLALPVEAGSAALGVSGDDGATGRRLLSHKAGAATGRVRATRLLFCAACERMRLLPIALGGACAGLQGALFDGAQRVVVRPVAFTMQTKSAVQLSPARLALAP